MSRRETESEWQELVKIPAVDQEDRVLANLTIRQVVQLGAVLGALWLAYQASRPYLPSFVFAIAAVPASAVAVAVVLTRREGVPLDRWLIAAWHHRRTPDHLVPTGTSQQDASRAKTLADLGLAALPLPARGIGADGALDLGEDGCAVVSSAATVNFALRTGGEQRMLIGSFGRWLNALTGPVQVLVRTHRLDLGPVVAGLRQAAPSLPHPLLEDAAFGYARFLSELAQDRDLLARQVLVVHREPGLDRAAVQRVQRRAAETGSLLSACEVQATVLDPGQVFAVLQSACDPSAPPHPSPAGPGQPVTFSSGGHP